MPGSTENLIQGAGWLYIAPIGTSEPDDTDIASEPASDWRPLGLTLEAVTLNVVQEYAELAADQLVDIPGRRLIKREVSIATSLAEVTLENMATALNELEAQVSDTSPTASDPGFKTFQPRADGLQGEPNYAMLLFDGFAPNGFPRRVIVRRALQVGEIEAAYSKEEQLMFPVEFAGHHVSNSVAPYKVVDQTAAPTS